MPSDFDPQCWIDGFQKRNGRLRQQPARSINPRKEPDPVNTMTPLKAASALTIKEGRLLVTPAIALRILEEMNYDRQRRVERSHVLALADQMAHGAWTAGTQIAFARLPNGKLALINGQHRMHGVVAANVEQEFQVAILPAETDHEVHQLYYRQDVVSRKRSTEMVLNAAGIAKEFGISKTTTRGAYEAGVIIACGLKRLQGQVLPPALKTPDGKLEAIHPYWTQVKTYDGLVRRADRVLKKAMQGGSVMAIAILTLSQQSDKAKEFWGVTALNDGLHKGDPRRALVLALLGRDMLVPGYSLHIAANAWNAWFDGRALTHLKAFPECDVRLRGVRLA